MNCTNCGYQNEPNAAYCSQCGVPAEPYARTKKKRKGLLIGTIVGGIMLIGAAVAALLLLGVPGVDGVWSCGSRGWVLQIEDGVMTEYKTAGTEIVRYTYNNGKGEAELQCGGASFTVTGDKLRLTDGVTGRRYLFIRQGKDFDIEQAVLEGIEGLWSSKELGEVIRLDGGVFSLYSEEGGITGSYNYDIRRGEGTAILEGEEYFFTVGFDTVSIDMRAVYTRADEGLDVTAFISRFGNPLPGIWYETTGQYGTITFDTDGTFELTALGTTTNGTYTYDSLSRRGKTVSLTGETASLSCVNGTLTLDDKTYTQDYVEQQSLQDMFGAVKGKWYDALGRDRTITFYSDGTVEATDGDVTISGIYRFDVSDQTGELILMDMFNDSRFHIFDNVLHVGEYSYRRQPVTDDDITNA